MGEEVGAHVATDARLNVLEWPWVNLTLAGADLHDSFLEKRSTRSDPTRSRSRPIRMMSSLVGFQQFNWQRSDLRSLESSVAER